MPDAVNRNDLKAELFRQVEEMGLQKALFPADRGEVDTIVQQLETLNPTLCPLASENLPLLLGDWQLVYASRGTVVTRKLDSFSQKSWAEVRVNRIWQQLTLGNNRQIKADNVAELELPFLGNWRIKADGIWRSTEDNQTAKVAFHAFSFQAIHLFGQSDWNLFPLTIPVLEALRNEALWITSYLDGDMRVGRGATGNLFVFRRQG